MRGKEQEPKGKERGASLLRTTLLALVLLASIHTFGGTMVDFARYGYTPGSGKDARAALNQALTDCRAMRGATLHLPKGRYDIHPTTNPDDAILFYRMNYFTLDAEGCDFVFHGMGRMFVVSQCSGITLRGFTTDSSRPATTQATIVAVADEWVDVSIDRDPYPYTIEDGHIAFTAPQWKKTAASFNLNLYDGQSHELVAHTNDSPLGTLFEGRAESQGDDVVRFHGHTPYRPTPGMKVAIHTQFQPWAGITIDESRDVTLQDLRVYHSFGVGILATHTENITIDNAFAAANEQKGRVFSTVYDNAHFCNCRGLISIQHCAPTGMGDDAVNIHGCYYEVVDVRDRHTLTLRLKSADIGVGEELWLVDSQSMQRTAVCKVMATDVHTDSKGRTCTVKTEQPLPKGLRAGDYAESKTWTPDVEIRHCQFGRKNRARAILVTTPGHVVIEDCTFATAGAAILIEGDTNRYLESGGCNDVTISHNTFDNCLTASGSQPDAGWGDAVIAITPSTATTTQYPPAGYHRNIRITDNDFLATHTPILLARSTDGLTFSGNHIAPTDGHVPQPTPSTAIRTEGCRHVSVGSNQWPEGMR